MGKDRSLEARVAELEDLVVNLQISVEALGDQQQARLQADWPRRMCNSAGCDTIIRAQRAEDLTDFCAAHTEASDAVQE